MKKITLSLLFIAASVFSNAQDCFWAKQAGGTNSGATSFGIVNDANGNSYVTGYYSGNNMSFNGISLPGTGGTQDIFVVKYDKSGVAKWAKRGSGTNSEEGHGITVDENGNTYITGWFGSPTLTFGTTVLTNYGVNAAFFIVKYDSTGNVKWAKTNSGSGNMGQYGEGISYDKNGNLYVTGSFDDTYIVFGNDTLFKNTNSDFFIAKYDTSGNVIWAKRGGGTGYDYGTSIASDPNFLYITGFYNSPFMTFGTDTVFRYSNMFILKYSASGNYIWGKCPKAKNMADEHPYCIAMDGNGNSYITGTIKSDSLYFGNIGLGNYSVNGGIEDAFIVKYDAGGNSKWVKQIGNTGADQGRGIAVVGNKVYQTGYSQSPSINIGPLTFTNTGTVPMYVAVFDTAGNFDNAFTSTGNGGGYTYGISVDPSGAINFTGVFGLTVNFGNATMTQNNGGVDFFIAHTYPFSLGVTTSNVLCYGSNNGSATSALTGGQSPFSYYWSAGGQTTSSITNVPASTGIDTLIVTDINGCMMAQTYSITGPPAVLNSICLVTVDSASQYNVIAWDKTPFTDVDSFIVYREISTNNYQPLAVIPYDSLSLFIDTVRTKYFPNTGDPNAGTYRYKITVHDTCGTYRALGPYHNTIYFLNNNGTFYWTQPYTIENAPNPVSSYVLLRDDNSTGNWQAVSSVAGTQQLVSDPLYSIYQNTASWRVQTQWSISCTPTAKMQNGTQSAFSSSYSNVYTNIGIGIKNNSSESSVSLYPSPNNGSFTVEIGALKNVRLEMYNVLGDLVYKSGLKNGKNVLDAKNLGKGTYVAYILSDSGKAIKKIVIE